ncbi:LysR family transcriptional regulator [Pseudonocardia sp.]|uniref:LysR family transcriptional regulator n=1 Tax=Pseudonocardia sp. TaxID=60912 RepID=UPI0031FC38A1
MPSWRSPRRGLGCQSALSQAVQSLEQLGVQLLNRSHSGTTPTAAGERLPSAEVT